MINKKDLKSLVSDQIERNGQFDVEQKELNIRINMSVAVSEALFESANAVHSLGEEGKKVEKSGGDFVSDHLLADSASEEALRDRIDKWGNEAGFKASIWGEEIGKNVEVGDRNSKNISFWTIDGLQNFINWAQKDENR